MTDRKSFLFACWEGGGNIPPMLTMTRRLIARGHDVLVIGDTCSRAEIEAAGARFRSWRRAPSRPDHRADSDPLRDWEAEEPLDVLRRIIGHYMCGHAGEQAEDVLDAIADAPQGRRVDAIVTSEMLLGPILAGEKAGVPVAALACNIPIIPLPGVPPFGPGFLPARDETERAMHAAVQSALDGLLAEGLPALNEARRGLGLAPLPATGGQFGSLAAYLCATAAAFDFPAEAYPPFFRYVGPLLDEPSWARQEAAPLTRPDRPLVLVSLSTTYQAQEAVLRRVVAALGALEVEAIVTTGPAVSPDSIEAPGNVRVVARASHEAILRQASVVITHCGHGTVMRALKAGVPLLCLPMGRDQNDNAARVAARGAGLRLEPSAEVEAIAEAVARLIADPSYREAADRLGRAIAAEMDAEAAADALEAITVGRTARPEMPLATAV